MPKVATIPSTSPRRQCSGRVRFDRDHIGPVVITFPLAIDSHEDILFDEDDLVEPDPAELTSISSGAVASTSNSAAGASSVGVQAVSRKAVARSRTIGIDEESPYANLKDKRFYGKEPSFYYFQYSSATAILEPPPIPPGLVISKGTLFVHRDTQDGRYQSWRRGVSDAGEDAWLPHQ